MSGLPSRLLACRCVRNVVKSSNKCCKSMKPYKSYKNRFAKNRKLQNCYSGSSVCTSYKYNFGRYNLCSGDTVVAIVSNHNWRIIACRQRAPWGAEKLPILQLVSLSTAQQLGIALCGESSLVLSSNLMELAVSREPLFSRSDHPGA
jgi:hypothetical protein